MCSVNCPVYPLTRRGAVRYNNKSGVLVLIDTKPTYLSGTDLVNLLQKHVCQ